jgi:hypothetical protein
VSRGTLPPCPWTREAVGLATHALDAESEVAVLRHMPECWSCQAAFREIQIVLGRLGEAVEQVEPPPALRASLLDRAERTPQGEPGPDADGTQ